MSSTPVQIQRVAALLGRRPVSWKAQTESSSPVLRFVVTFEEGQSVFVKIANNPRTAQCVRSESQVYRALGADFRPRLLAWGEDAMRPMLILEDLSSAIWPPPWTMEQVQQVLDALSRLRQSRPAIART